MKKSNFYIAIITIFALVSVSCENYLDVNSSPNGPGEEVLIPEIVLPGAQTRPSQLLMTDMNQLGNLMISTWSGNAQQLQTPFSTEFQHQITSDFYDVIWDRAFVRTSNLTHIMNFNNGANYDYYKAVAKIMKSFYFQYLVDIYGDIPYTQAHLRAENLFPSYDNQEDVYELLVDQIDEAIALIDNTNTATVIELGSNDVMLGGNISMWKKFGNTVKLRLLVRLMTKGETDTATSTYITNEIASLNAPGVSFIGLNENITINPGYSDEAERMNPFAEEFGFQPGSFGTSPVTNNTAIGPTEFLVEFLDGTTTGQTDNRLSRLYQVRPGQAQITGNVQGGNTNLPSRIGPGLLSSAIQVGYIMTGAESLLLQAEARERGYLTTGPAAKDLFQDAIRASFNMLGASGVETYITNTNATNLIGWDGTANKYEAIATQKWIALGGTNGLETWIEYTRTGFPSNMPLPVSTSKPSRPVRILYPSSEYSGNTSNVSVYNQNADTAFDTKIFWDVN